MHVVAGQLELISKLHLRLDKGMGVHQEDIFFFRLDFDFALQFTQQLTPVLCSECTVKRGAKLRLLHSKVQKHLLSICQE